MCWSWTDGMDCGYDCVVCMRRAFVVSRCDFEKSMKCIFLFGFVL